MRDRREGVRQNETETQIEGWRRSEKKRRCIDNINE